MLHHRRNIRDTFQYALDKSYIHFTIGFVKEVYFFENDLKLLTADKKRIS